MSKAEEKAMQYCCTKCANNKLNCGLKLLSHGRNCIELSNYITGYHQAEKDNELTWEDIKEICVQSVLVEVDLGGLISDERHYTEVLKRFKERKQQ